MINVNFPDCLAASIKGYRVTSQGKRKLGDELLERIDPRGQPYVWIGGLRSDEVQQEGTDLQAVAAELYLGHADSHGHDPSGQLRAPSPRPEVERRS